MYDYNNIYTLYYLYTIHIYIYPFMIIFRMNGTKEAPPNPELDQVHAQLLQAVLGILGHLGPLNV